MMCAKRRADSGRCFFEIPDSAAERDIVRLVQSEEAHDTELQMISQDHIFAARSDIQAMQVAPAVEQYIVDLVMATRQPELFGDHPFNPPHSQDRRSNFEPYEIGTGSSRLLKLIEGGHEGVDMPEPQQEDHPPWRVAKRCLEVVEERIA